MTSPMPVRLHGCSKTPVCLIICKHLEFECMSKEVLSLVLECMSQEGVWSCWGNLIVELFTREQLFNGTYFGRGLEWCAINGDR